MLPTCAELTSCIRCTFSTTSILARCALVVSEDLPKSTVVKSKDQADRPGENFKMTELLPTIEQIGGKHGKHASSESLSPAVHTDTSAEQSCSTGYWPSDSSTIDKDASGSVDAMEKYRLVVNTEPKRKYKTSRKQDDSTGASQETDTQVGESRPMTSAPVGSVSHVMKQQQIQKIICSPREYQIELFERSKEKNTIIVLDTGT